jgi:hypothetical protein
MSISLLNPFSFKEDMLNEDICDVIQEVIYYGESRFRVILNAISKADIDKQIWTQLLLRRELVCNIVFILFVSNSYIAIYFIIHWNCDING